MTDRRLSGYKYRTFDRGAETFEETKPWFRATFGWIRLRISYFIQCFIFLSMTSFWMFWSSTRLRTPFRAAP